MKILAEVLTSVRGDIHRRHRRQLRCIDCRADTDDLYQRVCVRAWRHRTKCRGSTAVEIRHWVMAIAANECRELLVEHLDRKRRSLKRTGRIQLAQWDGSYKDDSLGRMIEAESLTQQSRRVREELKRLTPRRRQAVQLRCINGWEYGRISSQLGVKVGHARALVSQGLLSLREHLAQ